MNQHNYLRFFRIVFIICLLIICSLLLNACSSGNPAGKPADEGRTELPAAETAAETPVVTDRNTDDSTMSGSKSSNMADNEIGILNYIAAAWDIHIDKVGKKETVLWKDKFYDPEKAYQEYTDYHTDPAWLEGAQRIVRGDHFGSDAEKEFFVSKFGNDIRLPVRLYAFYWICHSDAATTEEKKEAAAAFTDYYVQYKYQCELAMAAYHWLRESGLLTPEEKKTAAVCALSCVEETSSVNAYSDDVDDMFSLLTLKEAFEFTDKAHGRSFSVEGSFPLDDAFWSKVDAEGKETMAVLQTIAPLSELPDWVFVRDLKSVPHDQWFEALMKFYENGDMPVNTHLISVYLWYLNMDNIPQVIDWLDQRFPDMPESNRYRILYSVCPKKDCDGSLRLLYLLNQRYHCFSSCKIDNMVSTRAGTYDLDGDTHLEHLSFDGAEDVIANGERLETLPEGKILILSSKRYMAMGLYVPFKGLIEIPEKRFPENLDDVKYVILLYDQDGEVHQYTGIAGGTSLTAVTLSIADCVTSALVYDFHTGKPVGCLGSFVSGFGDYGSTENWSSNNHRAYRNIDGLFDWLATFY